MNVRKPTVYVVDDSRIARRIAKTLLTRAGYPVQDFETVQEVLARCAASLPDLILVDWNMPDKNGVDLIHAIRIRYGERSPRCILLTGEQDPQRLKEAMDAGACAVLKKPYSPEELLAAMGSSLPVEGELSSLSPGA